MRVNEAKICRELSNDFIIDGKEIIQVEMSQNQFAEAITSMGSQGVPVTIRRRADVEGRIEDCPFKDKRQIFEQEFTEAQNACKSEYNELVGFVSKLFDEKASIGKKDREEILKQMSIVGGKIFSNQAYVYKQFNEQMDKTVTEAKGEIEAFFQNKINQVAQQTLVENKDVVEKIGESENPVELG
jgi:hypothetical protein